MRQEGIRFATPLIKKQWHNIETLETAINYLDVMLTIVSQASLGSKGEEKYLQVHMRSHELLVVTINSKTGDTVAISDYAKSVDPILLHMLLTTIDTYVPHDFHHFLKQAYRIDLVRELGIEEIEVEDEEEDTTPTPEPVTQSAEGSLLIRTLVLSHVHFILSGVMHIEDVPSNLRPLVLEELASNNNISPQEWEQETSKLASSNHLPGEPKDALLDLIAKEMNRKRRK